MAEWNKQLIKKYTSLKDKQNKLLKQIFETKLNQTITVVFEEPSPACVGKVVEVGDFWFELEIEQYKDNFKGQYTTF